MSLWVLALLTGCNGGAVTIDEVESDTDTDADTDTDTDADTDTDTDADTDTDTDADTDADADTDTDPAPLCASVIDTLPSDGTTDAYYRTTVEWSFNAVDSSATAEISDGANSVLGTLGWDGNTLIFTSDAPLDASTTYTATTTWCAGTETHTHTFTTSDVGSSVSEPDLVERTYYLDVAAGRFVEPAGVGALLQGFIDLDMLIGVSEADANNVTFRGGFLDPFSSQIAQNTCVETFDFPLANFDQNPFFTLGPRTTAFDIGGGNSMVLTDMVLSGSFTPDSSGIVGGVLAGSVDTRPLVGLVDASGPPSTICSLVAAFGTPCQACPDGSGVFCLDLLVDQLEATEVPGLILAERTTDDITDDPICNP